MQGDTGRMWVGIGGTGQIREPAQGPSPSPSTWSCGQHSPQGYEPTGRYFYRAAPLKPWALPGGVTPSSLECKDYTPSHSLRPFESWLCTPLWLLPPSLSPQAIPFLLPGRTWASGPLAFSSNSQGSAQEPFPPIPPGAQGSAQDLPVS